MSDNFTAEDLKALEEAMAKGILSVEYTDRKVTYRSVDDMLKIRDVMRQCLGLNGDEGRGRRRLATTDKGLC